MQNRLSASSTWEEIFESDEWKNLGLTPRQQKFVRAYTEKQQGKIAACAAGYSQKTAAAQACNLLKERKVKAALRFVSKLLDSPLSPSSNHDLMDSLSNSIKNLEAIAFAPNVTEIKRSDQLKALELLLRYLTPHLSRSSSTMSTSDGDIVVTFETVDGECKDMNEFHEMR